jgi:hypothetical protein
MDDLKFCHDCEKWKTLDKFQSSFGIRKHLKHRCKACYSRRERAQMKHDFLEAMGNKCNCCGEDDVRFLTLDHVDGSGAEDRKFLQEHQIYREARRLKYPPDRYQVLCFNCNCGRSANGGICPHNSSSKEEAWELLKSRTTKVGRMFVDIEKIKETSFMPGFDARRMQLSRRVLKPCQYCGEEFGTNGMVKHKREKHKDEFAKKRAECLALGRNK